MGKKAKPSVDKVVTKVNKEFEKASSQIEGLFNDALKQFDHLQQQVQEPVRKLLKEVDDLREREMKRFNDEFERRMGEFRELQESILDRLGVAAKSTEKKAKQAKKELESSAKKATKQAKAKSPASPKKATPAKKKATPSPRASAKPAKATDKSDLTAIKGIGPATAKKMKDAGITSIDQIANPSAADQEKLEAFSSAKGFDQFSTEAKKLL
ncbi:hypothetical protein LPB19_11740 [Marinobacter salinisoli]|uniref:Helix-hairpin-helix domain-containing protein n=1 Tax=Marinobacter salinisoli TaxID=2769486 RepID=A0ABX7MRY9_9GAMM|nr:helix-hairpin-helix domain-containing protein [Marinobacter salinisoli]QSP93866.1 hypothetical protein LPB19_11740 [Marinobacter salinisoli]